MQAMNRVSATLWKDRNPARPGEFIETLAAPIRNASKVYINDFKLVYNAAPATVPNFVRLKFVVDGNYLEANDAVVINQFVVFPVWDLANLTLRESYAYPGQLIWQAPGRQTPFTGIHCTVTDEFNNQIDYQQLGLKMAVDFEGIPNTHAATSQSYPNTPVGLYNAGTPF